MRYRQIYWQMERRAESVTGFPHRYAGADNDSLSSMKSKGPHLILHSSAKVININCMGYLVCNWHHAEYGIIYG